MFLRQCFLMRTLHLYLIQMQYIDSCFNEPIQLQLGPHMRLEKMCVKQRKKIKRQSNPGNSDLSQDYHPKYTTKTYQTTGLLHKSEEVNLNISLCLGHSWSGGR